MKSKHMRKPLSLRFVAVLLGLAVLAAACGSDAEQAANPIQTNEGGVLVTPPDVLEGETEIGEDGVDTAALPPIDDSTLPDTTDFGPAPEVAFTWFDGTPATTSDLEGRPTVINFWATTCAACVAEMPHFEEVFQEAAGVVNFVGMNTAGDPRDAAVRLATETGVTYPLAVDDDGSLFIELRNFAMPTTVLLRADGQIGYKWTGVLTANELKILINEHIAPGTFTDV